MSSTRRLTNIQFSDNHAIDGTRIQSALDDIFNRVNSIPIEDVEKRHTLQTIVLKCSGKSIQDMPAFSKVAGAVTGTDRPEAPFLNVGMVPYAGGATQYRAKGINTRDNFGFLWTASTFFLKPVTLESVSLHIDSDLYTPFSALVYDVTFTGAHGLAAGEKIYTTSNNAYTVDATPAPTGGINQIFRVTDVKSSTEVTLVWYATRAGAATPFPGLGYLATHPLTFSNGAATLTASALKAVGNTQTTRLLIDCPYLQYSTDPRLNAKAFVRDSFSEQQYCQPALTERTPAAVEMYPAGIPNPGGMYAGFTPLYLEETDLNIALPSAQAVNFRLAVGHSTKDFEYPAALPRATYVITYREQILD